MVRFLLAISSGTQTRTAPITITARSKGYRRKISGHDLKATDGPKNDANKIPPAACSSIVPMNAVTRIAFVRVRRVPTLNALPRFLVRGDTNITSAIRWSHMNGTGGLGIVSHWKGGESLGKFEPTKISVFGLMMKRARVAMYARTASFRLPRINKLTSATFSAPPKKSSPPNFRTPADPGMKAAIMVPKKTARIP